MKRDIGLLILRVVPAAMMVLGHGWGKLLKVAAGNFAFADPIGLGPALSLILTALAEVLFTLAVAVGFRTRWTAIPPLVAMLVAGFVAHAADPFHVKEKALLFATIFLVLTLTGGGRYSLDTALGRKST